MKRASVLLPFVPADLALNLKPVADMMCSLARGLCGGVWAAIAESAAIALGIGWEAARS